MHSKAINQRIDQAKKKLMKENKRKNKRKSKKCQEKRDKELEKPKEEITQLKKNIIQKNEDKSSKFFHMWKIQPLPIRLHKNSMKERSKNSE